jgi:hypothetical protein
MQHSCSPKGSRSDSSRRPFEGRLMERDAWLFVAADRELPVGSSDNWAGG